MIISPHISPKVCGDRRDVKTLSMPLGDSSFDTKAIQGPRVTQPTVFADRRQLVEGQARNSVGSKKTTETRTQKGSFGPAVGLGVDPSKIPPIPVAVAGWPPSSGGAPLHVRNEVFSFVSK